MTVIPFRPLKITTRKPRLHKRLFHSRQRYHYEWHQRFGRRLKYVRARLGVSEAQAAELFGVTLKTYRRYERGLTHRDNTEGTIAFALTYGLSMDWFLGCPGALPPRVRLRAV
jgi:DNA-binding XRE family transcriptional regulator